MQRLIFCALAVVALSATGCHHKLWHKKHANCDCASCDCDQGGGGCDGNCEGKHHGKHEGGCGEGCPGCESCGHGHGHKHHHGLLHHHPHVKHLGGNDGHRYGGYAAEVGPPGPPTGAVAYPYYTTRGPRDFFTNNPPSIGP